MCRKFLKSLIILSLFFGLFSCNRKNDHVDDKLLRNKLPGELSNLFAKILQEKINVAGNKKVIRLLDSAEERYKKNPLCVAFINFRKYDYYMSLQQLDKALLCGNIAYAFFKRNSKFAKLECIKTFKNLAYLYVILGDNNKAMTYIKEAEYEINRMPPEQIADFFYLISEIYYNYAYILTLDKEYKRARFYSLKILQLPIPADQNRNIYFKSTCYKIADLYEKTGQVDSALLYIAKSKQYNLANEKIDNEAKQNMNSNLEMAYLRLASKIYRRQHKLDSAMISAEKSFAMLKQEGWLIENNDLATQLALDYFELGKLKKASEYYEHAKHYFFIETVTNYENKEKVITDLIDFAIKTKRYQDIDLLTNTYQKILKENYNNQKAIAIKNAEIIYQVKTQNDQIERLALANELKSAVIKQRTIILSSAFLLVIAFIFFYYYQLRVKEKYLAIDLEQRLRLAQMNPHFIANALSAIQRQIYEGETKVAVSYLNKYAVLNRLILENSRNKYIYLNDEITILKKYLELQQVRVTNKFDYKFNLSETLIAMIEEVKIPNMLLQPLIENVFEHAFKNISYRGFLEVKMTLDYSYLICEIIDNGIGKQHNWQEQPKKSFSIKIIQERLALLNKQNGTKSSFEMSERQDGQSGLAVKLMISFITDYD